MTSQNLANLVKVGSLKAEPFDQKEFDGFVESGRISLNDALRTALAIESRFYLGYNAAHSQPSRAGPNLPQQSFQTVS